MKRLALFSVCAFLASVLSASAQTVTAYTCPIRQGPVVVSTVTIPVSALTCGQAPLVAFATDNPTKIAFTDPAVPTAICVYTDPPTGVLSLLPFGSATYTASCAPVNSSGGLTPDSLPSNTFTRPGILAPVVTGVKVYRE